MKRLGVGTLTLATKLGLKFGPKLLKLAKVLKLGKAGLAGASMASYAYLFSWQFAALVMVLLFVHESGHIWAMRKCGVKTKGIYFIPFLGAAAVADNQFPSRKAEVFIAIMGPIWGLALSFAVAGAYLATANPLFAAAASWMAMINLFNLLPINPLDGGRIMKSIAFSVHSFAGLIFLALGILAAGFIAFIGGLWLFVVLLLVGCFELAMEYRERYKAKNMNTSATIGSALAYFCVAGVLWWIMSSMKHIPGAAVALELLMG